MASLKSKASKIFAMGPAIAQPTPVTKPMGETTVVKNQTQGFIPPQQKSTPKEDVAPKPQPPVDENKKKEAIAKAKEILKKMKQKQKSKTNKKAPTTQSKKAR